MDRRWVLGDLVAIGPEPVPTLAPPANLPAVPITSGNTERDVRDDQDGEAARLVQLYSVEPLIDALGGVRR